MELQYKFMGPVSTIQLSDIISAANENLLVTRQYLRSTSNDGEGQGIRIRDKPVGDRVIHNHVTNRCRGAGRGEARTEFKVWLQSPTPRKVRLNISIRHTRHQA